MNGIHSGCYLDEPCTGKNRASCPAAKAKDARQAALIGEWSQLELRESKSGSRHYLDGEPIHCGATLELQAIEFVYDDFGQYTRPLQKGLRVRYELHGSSSFANGVVLFVSVEGHEFTTRLSNWHRFRWPLERRN